MFYTTFAWRPARLLVVLLVACAALTALAGIAAPARAASETQQLVTKAKWTFDKLVKHTEMKHLRRMLPKAEGVMIFPNILKGAFFIGAEGGSGVMLGRRGKRRWSYPAFFTMGAASFGFQIGGEAKEVVLLLMTKKAVAAMIASEVKLGADISVSIGPVGGGIEGSTTTAAGADIVAFSLSKGAFAGVSFEGAVVHERSKMNAAYYKHGATARQIVQHGKWSNKGADPLRKSLARY